MFVLLSLRQVNSHRSRCAYPGCVFLYVTSSVESPRALGSVHGIGQTTASLVRAVGRNIPLRVHDTEWLGRWTRSLCRPHRDILVWLALGMQASGESVGAQVTKHPYLM